MYVTVEDGDAEVEYVVESILGNREQGMRLMDQAVLFRGRTIATGSSWNWCGAIFPM